MQMNYIFSYFKIVIYGYCRLFLWALSLFVSFVALGKVKGISFSILLCNSILRCW